MSMTLEQAIKILHPVENGACATDDEFFANLDQIEPALLLACEVMQREVDRRADHSGEVNRIVSNADKIRSMSDEELLEFLIAVEVDGIAETTADLRDWLRQPAKEEKE